MGIMRARALTTPTFIRELCIAYAHRWVSERLYVILTGYLDESGTHAGSQATVMAGVMANARQWEKFEWAFQTVKKEFGFMVFRTKEFKKKRGDLRGWSNEKA